MASKHRHVSVTDGHTGCETCTERLVGAVTALGYRVTEAEDVEFTCGVCGEELKPADGMWWHAAERGDYQPASHAARPVPGGRS